MSWLDKLKAGLNVANVVTAAFPVPSWAKQAQKVAHVGVRAYELDRRAPVPDPGKLPSELQPLSYEPPVESFLTIQLPGENFVRKIKLGELAWLILDAKRKKEGE